MSPGVLNWEMLRMAPQQQPQHEQEQLLNLPLSSFMIQVTRPSCSAALLISRTSTLSTGRIRPC